MYINIMGIGCTVLAVVSIASCGAINNTDILLFDMYVMVYGLYQNNIFTGAGERFLSRGPD